MAQLSVKFESSYVNKILCRLCGNQTNPKQRFAIFSLYGNEVKLQRLISDFAKITVKYDDCLPKHLCRNCYRILLNLKDKLFTFQAKCAATQKNFAKGGDKVKRVRSSPKSSPSTSPSCVQRPKRSRLNEQRFSARKELSYDEKEKLLSSESENYEKESTNATATVHGEAFPVLQSSSSTCQLAETQPSTAKTVLQPCANSSPPATTSTTSEKEVNTEEDRSRKALDIISNSGLNNPAVSFTP